MRDRQPSKNRTQADFGRAKRSFDQVMAVYRASQFTGIQATDYRHTSATTPNRATPTSVEFRIDVDLCIRKKVPAAKLARFKAAYCYFDSDQQLENEIIAEKVMGLKRHRIEQRLGALFIEKGIWPIKQYFSSVRKGIDEWKNQPESEIRVERLEGANADGESESLPQSTDPAVQAMINSAYAFAESQGGAA